MSIAHNRGKLLPPLTILTAAMLTMAGCSQMPEMRMPGSSDPAAQPASETAAPVAGTRAEPATPAKTAEPVVPAEEQKPVAVSQPAVPATTAPAEKSQPALAARPVEEAPAPAEDYSKLPANTFVVHSVMKDASHLYFKRGSEKGFSVNGVQSKPLVVVRGQRYVFRVDTDIQHDFYLARKGVGRGGFTVANGVKGNFIYNGEVIFTPDSSTPDVVYYACRNHAYMGGPIFVVNPGQRFDLKKAMADLKASLAQGGGMGSPRKGKVSARMAKQKIDFTRMYVSGSAVAKRIEASDHAEAKRLYADAVKAFDKAQQSYEKKKYAAALGLADQAMKAMSKAGRLVPAPLLEEGAEDTAGKAKYKELVDGLKTYRKSYRKNHQLLAKQKGAKGLPDVDLAAIEATERRAAKLADAGDYRQANALLGEAQTTLTEALSAMLKSQTLSYELVFETPKDEYEYELSRYLSYEELVPLAIEQKRPSAAMQGIMDKYVKRGQGIKAEALPVAASGDYKKAILMLQGATSHIRRALRVVGVR